MANMNFMIQAIMQLDPNAKWDIFGEDDIRILNSQITLEDVKTLANNLEEDHKSTAYRYKRAQEYPSIGDQLDALFHAGLFPADMAQKIQAVKDKYPK